MSVLVLVTLAACSSGSEQKPQAVKVESGTFSVLTYNVAGLPVEISKEHPDVNLPKISPLLEPYDLVLTQEDFDWWKPGGLASTVDFVNYHDRLRAKTTHRYKSARHPGYEAVGLDVTSRPVPEVGDGLGVLSRFPIKGNERVPWTGCAGGFDQSDGGAADCLSMKGFSMTRLTLPGGGSADVYNLHGEAGSGEKDQSLQAADFKQLASYLNKHSKGRAVILAGDTNLHTDSDHPDAHGDADTEIWKAFLAATGLTDACSATRCTETDRIDKLAYRSGDGLDLAATGYRVEAKRFSDENGKDLSDHEPVAVDLRWTATK